MVDVASGSHMAVLLVHLHARDIVAAATDGVEEGEDGLGEFVLQRVLTELYEELETVGDIAAFDQRECYQPVYGGMLEGFLNGDLQLLHVEVGDRQSQPVLVLLLQLVYSLLVV